MGRAEVYVYSADAERQGVKNWFDRCNPLYGSVARVDEWGTILIPSWRRIRNKDFNPDGFEFLSPSRALRTGLIKELKISEIKKDGGSVGAAIRMTQHILESVKGGEREQAEMILQRSNELIDLFQDGLAIPEEQRRALQEETKQMLMAVALNPERVMLEELERAAKWLEKASLGKDETGRDNWLITMGALFASRRRGWARKEELEGFVVPKYAGMLEALIFAMIFDRDIMIQTKEDLRVLSGIKYIKYPGETDSQIGYTQGKVGSMAWLLTQAKVKPFRLMALATGVLLEEVREKMGTEAIDGYQEKILEERQVVRELLEGFAVVSD